VWIIVGYCAAAAVIIAIVQAGRTSYLENILPPAVGIPGLGAALLAGSLGGGQPRDPGRPNSGRNFRRRRIFFVTRSRHRHESYSIADGGVGRYPATAPRMSIPRVPTLLDRDRRRRPRSDGRHAIAHAAKIIGACARPGSATARVLGRDGIPLVLTTHHVLFGDAGERPDAATIRIPGSGRRLVGSLQPVRGAIGLIGPDRDCFVDCAVGRADSRHGPLLPIVDAIADVPATGALLHKVGVSTGATWGRLIDVAYEMRCRIGARSFDVANNLLIRAETSGHNFAAPGDSGALVHDEQGRAVALLWGCTGNGDGVATPLGPVLRELDVTIGGEQ
jgi:hypothetical protein